MPSKLKTMKIKLPDIRVTFNMWYGWFGDRYENKMEAVEVWKQMTHETGIIDGELNDETIEALVADCFADVMDEAEEVISHQQSRNQCAAVSISGQQT
jgi:hypothetical protein